MRDVPHQHIDVNRYPPSLRPKKLRPCEISVRHCHAAHAQAESYTEQNRTAASAPDALHLHFPAARQMRINPTPWPPAATLRVGKPWRMLQVCNCRRDPKYMHTDTFCCGSGCLNRTSFILCDSRSCPCRGDCRNKPFNLRRHPSVQVALTDSRCVDASTRAPHSTLQRTPLTACPSTARVPRCYHDTVIAGSHATLISHASRPAKLHSAPSMRLLRHVGGTPC
jgi:AWS domain